MNPLIDIGFVIVSICCIIFIVTEVLRIAALIEKWDAEQ